MLPEGDEGTGQTYKSCCGKVICSGCNHAHNSQFHGKPTCPFCRTPSPNEKQYLERLNKRIEANDANAFFALGTSYLCGDGKVEVPQDRAKGLQLLIRGGELGSAKSYHQVAYTYMYGDDGIEKDEKKARHYYDLGAIGGHVGSRHNLGVYEYQAGNFDKAAKHYMIAAGFGQTGSLKSLRVMFHEGRTTRNDYYQALLSYKQYLEEVRSDQRNEAAAFHDDYKYLFDLRGITSPL